MPRANAVLQELRANSVLQELRANSFLQELRANDVLQERRANVRMISDVNVAIATDISFVFLIKSFLCSAHISFIFLCSVHISVIIPIADKASLLRRMPPNVAIATLRHCVALATFGGSRCNNDALGHSVAIATSSSKRRNCETLSKCQYCENFL